MSHLSTMLARVSLLLAALVAATSSLPQLPPGVDPAACPNYPFCGEGPAGQSAVYITIITKVPQCPKGTHITVTHFYNISYLRLWLPTPPPRPRCAPSRLRAPAWWDLPATSDPRARSERPATSDPRDFADPADVWRSENKTGVNV